MQTATGVMQIASPLFFVVNTVRCAAITHPWCGGLQQLSHLFSFGDCAVCLSGGPISTPESPVLKP
jgi:hypothetical protein